MLQTEGTAWANAWNPERNDQNKIMNKRKSLGPNSETQAWMLPFYCSLCSMGSPSVSIRENPMCVLPPARLNPSPRQESQQQMFREQQQPLDAKPPGLELPVTATPPQPRWELHMNAAMTILSAAWWQRPEASWHRSHAGFLSSPALSRRSQLFMCTAIRTALEGWELQLDSRHGHGPPQGLIFSQSFHFSL